MSYLKNAPGRRATPQNRPIPGSGQVENQAGGFAWSVDPLTRMRRFLILGSEGATYYASENKQMEENVQALYDADPMDALALITEVSHEGIAPKNDPAIFALAFYAGHKDEKVRREALRNLERVCRTTTHLFHFCAYVEKHRGWGRSLRRAIATWYADKSPDDLAYQMVKYRQRDGYTHRDLLRLAHIGSEVSSNNPSVEGVTETHGDLFAWACGRTPEHPLPDIVQGYIEAQSIPPAGDGPKRMAKLIEEYELPREAVPNEFLTHKEVWGALLNVGMPMTALIRNLPTMTRVGLLKPMGSHTAKVVQRITSQDALRNAKVHPLNVLVAHLTYAVGHSIRGSATWEPVREIVEALDKAFYMAFANVQPTGKRHLLALDVSGSMDTGVVNGVPGLTPRVASSAMAMVTAHSGDPYHIVAFTGKGGWNYDPELTPLTFSPQQRLQDICRATDNLPFGRTDCALPMLYALGQELEVDTFVIYTDSETWAGNIHPSQALQKYRENINEDARLVVVGMVSNGFSIADPNDPGMLDVVGFDTTAPQMISDFSDHKL
jgi:60 kDa SS-A/Ro ribonucleoprotein